MRNAKHKSCFATNRAAALWQEKALANQKTCRKIVRIYL